MAAERHALSKGWSQSVSRHHVGLSGLAGSDGEHKVDRILDGDFEFEPIQDTEHGERLPRQPLVPVGEGMVLGDSYDQHRSFGGEVGIELDLTESGLRRMQR